MFTLAVSCLTTSNLPWFMDVTFRVHIQYCSLQHWALLPSPVTSTTGHCFTLAPSLHSFWSYFSTVSGSILGTYWPGEFIFQYHIFLTFHTVHGEMSIMLKVRHSALVSRSYHRDQSRCSVKDVINDDNNNIN